MRLSHDRERSSGSKATSELHTIILVHKVTYNLMGSRSSFFALPARLC
jgi:hypothetical protein